MNADEARRRLASARVARLATADGAGRPHLVPMVFTVLGETIYSAVDGKPKRTTELRRLANVRANPRVAVLVDHYDDVYWNALWWVRADGAGRVLDPEAIEAIGAIALLTERYPQYRSQPPTGPVLAVDVERWTAWSAE